MPPNHKLSKIQLQSKIRLLESQLVYGFYENLYPHFIQGSGSINSLCELVTAEQLTLIFHRLFQLQFENWQLKRKIKP